jgi:predicted secreted protein
MSVVPLLFRMMRNAHPAVSLPIAGHSLNGEVVAGGVRALEEPAKILKNAPANATDAKTAPMRRSAPADECAARVRFVDGRPEPAVADPDGI